MSSQAGEHKTLHYSGISKYPFCTLNQSDGKVILLPGLVCGRLTWMCSLHPAVMTGAAERGTGDVRTLATVAAVVTFSSASATPPLGSAL